MFLKYTKTNIYIILWQLIDNVNIQGVMQNLKTCVVDILKMC